MNDGILQLMDYDLRHFLRNQGKDANLIKRLDIALGAMNGLLYLHSQVTDMVTVNMLSLKHVGGRTLQ